jgi:hypothetical protein
MESMNSGQGLFTGNNLSPVTTTPVSRLSRLSLVSLTPAINTKLQNFCKNSKKKMALK